MLKIKSPFWGHLVENRCYCLTRLFLDLDGRVWNWEPQEIRSSSPHWSLSLAAQVPGKVYQNWEIAQAALLWLWWASNRPTYSATPWDINYEQHVMCVFDVQNQLFGFSQSLAVVCVQAQTMSLAAACSDRRCPHQVSWLSIHTASVRGQLRL